MTPTYVTLLLAFLLDITLGDPVYPFHPVRLIGHLITGVEKALSAIKLRNFLGGAILLLGCQSITLGVFYGIYKAIFGFEVYPSIFLPLVCAFLVYSSLTVKDLSKHARKVCLALDEGDLKKSRDAVQMIIGRDANQLDRAGIARATVESVAESFIDGFLAPVFWFCMGCVLARIMAFPLVIGGTALILFYRVTNTLDSMVGYKNETYRTFGTVSARLDDLLNLIPARLGIFVLTISAVVCRFDAKNAWKIGWRDRLKHSSPNAGHSEAVVAGALNIKLNGPGVYPHGVVDKPWVGDGTTDLTTGHIAQTSRLIWTAAGLTMIIGLSVIFILG